MTSLCFVCILKTKKQRIVLIYRIFCFLPVKNQIKMTMSINQRKTNRCIKIFSKSLNNFLHNFLCLSDLTKIQRTLFRIDEILFNGCCWWSLMMFSWCSSMCSNCCIVRIRIWRRTWTESSVLIRFSSKYLPVATISIFWRNFWWRRIRTLIWCSRSIRLRKRTTRMKRHPSLIRIDHRRSDRRLNS